MSDLEDTIRAERLKGLQAEALRKAMRQVEIEEQRQNIRERKLHEALDVIPAALMLETGPPYTLNFSEESLKLIAAAQEGME